MYDLTNITRIIVAVAIAVVIVPVDWKLHSIPFFKNRTQTSEAKTTTTTTAATITMTTAIT